MGFKSVMLYCSPNATITKHVIKWPIYTNWFTPIIFRIPKNFFYFVTINVFQFMQYWSTTKNMWLKILSGKPICLFNHNVYHFIGDKLPINLYGFDKPNKLETCSGPDDITFCKSGCNSGDLWFQKEALTKFFCSRSHL